MDRLKQKEFQDLKLMYMLRSGNNKDLTALLGILYLLSLALPEEAPPRTMLRHEGHKGFPIFHLLSFGFIT